MLGVFSEQSHSFWSTPPPVPWDKCDVGRKLVPFHQRQKFLKVYKAVGGLQQRVINHQTSVYLWSVPADLSERPLNIKHKRHRTEEVLTDVEILRLQFRAYIDNFWRCKKKDRHAFIFELPEYRAIPARDNVDQIPLGSV